MDCHMYNLHSVAVVFDVVYLILLYRVLTDPQTPKCLSCVYICMIIPGVYKTVSLGILRMVPHSPILRDMVDVSYGLLECLEDNTPGLDMHRVKDCINGTTVYRVPKSLVPYSRTLLFVPTAFVVPELYSNYVFTVNEKYDDMTDVHKSLTLIHECTHLALGTVDYAYLWETQFDGLTDDEHVRNADSYVDMVIKKCLNADVVF